MIGNGERLLSRERGNYRQAFIKKNKGLFGSGVYLCGYCFKPVLKGSMEVDHIVPFSKGGLNHHSNLTASCRKCNRKKSDKVDKRIAIGYTTKIIGVIFAILFGIVAGVIFLPFKFFTNKKISKKFRAVAGVAVVGLVIYVLKTGNFI